MKKMMDSTTVIITTTDNRVLLQKRDENPDIEYSGYYSLVSGYLEEEETPLDGIIRELKEEFEHKKSQKVHFSSITYLGSEYRGNHYHFRKVEYMLILQGRMHATFQKYDDSEAVIEEIWEKGDLVRTLPGCVHTLTALGESNVLTIEFSPQPYVARDVLMNDKK